MENEYNQFTRGEHQRVYMTVNNDGIIFHKTGHGKGKRHDYNVCRHKKNPPVTPKIFHTLMFLTLDIGLEKDYPKQISSFLPKRKKRDVNIYRGENLQPRPC